MQRANRSRANGSMRAAAVKKIAAFYQTAADDHHVTISCSGNGQVYADPDLFERAVGNLLDNALRFTAEHGSIRVAVSRHNSDFEVAVSDNGSGIARRTFAARFRPLLPCRIIARLRRRRPWPGFGKIDSRSSWRLRCHREQPGPWHNGQTNIPVSAETEVITAHHLSVARRMTKK